MGEFLGVAESAAPASAGPAREIAEAAPTRPASAPWRGKTAAWIALAVLVGAVAFLLRPPPGADHSDDEVVPHPPLAPEAPNPSPLLAVTRGAPFRNSLDMEFIPVAIVGAPPAAPRILFSRYETRRRDYAAFAGEVRVIADDWRAPDFAVLSDAYAIHTRLRRSPTARLYPGDADARCISSAHVKFAA